MEPVACAARRRGLGAGASLTLGTGWDFRDESHRQKAKRLVRKTKPYVLLLAFPCGDFSPLMNLNPPADLGDRRAESAQLVEFAIELACIQMAGGRHFVMENPLPSLAWKLPRMQSFIELEQPLSIVIDMCRFNLRSEKGNLRRKATRLLTSMQSVISTMTGRRCTGDHVHDQVIGGSKVTAAAGHYTVEFSDALIDAFMAQYDWETRLLQSQPDSLPHETMVGEADGQDAGSDDELMRVTDEEAQCLIPHAVRQAVMKLRINTGHRHPVRLARALLICGAPKEAVLAAKRLQCDVCKERAPPKARLPASLPPPREVGQQAHIDLVVLDDSFGKSYFVGHITDHVSKYQQAKVLQDKSIQSIIHFLVTQWIPLMGVPATLVADQGREFVSGEFGDWCDSRSIYLYHVGVGAPWQTG